MLTRLLQCFARRSYRAGYADGYSAGRDSRQQQSYAQGYRDGKQDARQAEDREVAVSRAKLDEAYRWGWEQGRIEGIVQAANATLDASQGITKAVSL